MFRRATIRLGIGPHSSVVSVFLILIFHKVVMHLRCGGIFTAKSVGETILKIGQHLAKLEATRMWANAHRDGRPAEYRWRPLFNTAKFG